MIFRKSWWGFSLTLVASYHIILPQCGFRLEVDYKVFSSSIDGSRGVLLQHCCSCHSFPPAIPDYVTRDRLIGGSPGEAQEEGGEEKRDVSGIMHSQHLNCTLECIGIQHF